MPVTISGEQYDAYRCAVRALEENPRHSSETLWALIDKLYPAVDPAPIVELALSFTEVLCP